MKRFRIWILLVVLALLFFACNGVNHYKLIQPEDQIVKISIVQLSYEFWDERIVRNTICEITDVDTFLSDFKKIECKRRFDFSDLPTNLHGDAIAIKFDYRNGFYELVDWKAQFQFDPIRNGIYSASALTGHFNQRQFEAFLQKYMK